MVLTIYQKSVYLVILNATMVLRSIGKTFHGDKEKLEEYKRDLFKEIECLTEKIDESTLKESDIINSTEKLKQKYDISFGQSQKGINVILKYHFYLCNRYNNQIKQILHCPLDKFILKKLGKNITLNKLEQSDYNDIQKEIQNKFKTKLDFDKEWDEQHLTKNRLIHET